MHTLFPRYTRPLKSLKRSLFVKNRCLIFIQNFDKYAEINIEN